MHHSTSTSTTNGIGRALLLLLAINLINYIDRYILAAVEPLIAEHFFASTDENAMAKTGSLAFAFLASYMLLAPCFGALADRFSRWMIIAAGVALWSFASGASGLANTFGALVLTRVFVGVGEAAYGPAAPTIISDLYPVERRGRMLAYFYLAMPVGSALGYAFGGAITDRGAKPRTVGGPASQSRDNHRLYGRLALAFLPRNRAWPFSRRLMPFPPRSAQRAAFQDSRRKSAHRRRTCSLRIRSYVLNTAAMTAMTFAIGGMSFWLPRYLYSFRAADFGGAPSLSRITFMFGAITAVAGLLATLLGGWVG
jgi:MFS family permease